MGFQQEPKRISPGEAHATALQKVLDMPNLPGTFRKQVHAVARSYPKAAPLLLATSTIMQ